MTFNEKIVMLGREIGLNVQAKQRTGQATWNAAMLIDPTLVEFTDTELDPYYNDAVLPAFMAMLVERWKDEPSA
jgi:hypothetical protein